MSHSQILRGFLWLCVWNDSFAPSKLRAFCCRYPGFRQASTLGAKSRNRFAVENSHTARHVSHLSPLAVQRPGATDVSKQCQIVLNLPACHTSVIIGPLSTF